MSKFFFNEPDSNCVIIDESYNLTGKQISLNYNDKIVILIGGSGMKMKSLFLLPLLAITLSAIMPNYSDAHLATTSDLIIVGRIFEKGYGEFIQGHNVCTPWEVEIEDVIAGTSGSPITFYTQGGQLPYSNNKLWVEDQALPVRGQRALMFLEKLDDQWFVNGLFLGYRPVINNKVEGIPLEKYRNYIKRLADGEDIPKPSLETPPTVSSMSISGFTPTIGPAGDGSVTVTINGSGFGSSEGTVEFTYYQWPGYDPTFLDPSWTTISYWSDTEIHTDVPPHASSGPIRVTPTSGPAQVSSSDFEVTFGYYLKLWPPATPVYVTLTHNDATYPVPGCGPAMESALETWSTAGAWFRYIWGGTTTDADPQFDGGSNGNNSMHFGIFPGSSPPLGICQIYYGWPITEIYEMDIRFNDEEDWSAGDPVTANDVESIALHEAGHGLQLLDVYGILDLGEVMYGVSMTGSSNRTLSTDDNDGIIYIYGSDGSTEILQSNKNENEMDLKIAGNPVRNSASITLELGVQQNIEIEVFDMLGRKISTPFKGNLKEGVHSFVWQPENGTANGVYFLKINSERETITRKLLVLE